MGGGADVSPRAAVGGNTGGAGGGGGMLCPACLPAASLRLATKVRVCSVMLDAVAYSRQHTVT